MQQLGPPRALGRALPAARSLAGRQLSSLWVYNYRLYFFGQLVSLTGTWIQTTGQAWLVLKLTGSPVALGTVTTLQFLPITLFSLVGGALADRLPKRRVLFITQTVALGQAAALGTLVATGQVELWHVYVLALVLGTANAIDGPTRQAFVPELVGKGNLVNAVALNSSIFNGARIVGPGVAGAAIALVGVRWTFFLNAASFIAVLAAYAAMRPAHFHQAASRGHARAGVLKSIGEGFRYALRTPSVLFILLMLAFVGTFGFNFTVIVPLFAEFVLGVSPAKFGLLTSAMGVGSLACALVLAGLGRTSRTLLLASAFSMSLVLGLLAVTHSFGLAMLLFALLGVAGLAFSTTANTTLQLTVPDALRGRVMSLFFLLMAGTTPIGGYLTGFLAEHRGVGTALATEAALCGLGVAVAMAYLALGKRRGNETRQESA